MNKPVQSRELSELHSSHDSFPLFDWLRFILASVVALHHEGLLGWPNAGNLAVQVFFALSGWLIGGILLNTSRNGLPRFYYNRATRIWIPYAIAVAILYAVGAAHDPATATPAKFLFYDLTFTHNWFIDVIPSVVSTMPLQGTGNHFWSISVEEQFYLAAPVLLVLVPRSIALWTAIAAVAVASGSWYGSICLGVLAALVRQSYGDWHQTVMGRVSLAVACGALAGLLAFVPSAYAYGCAPLAAGIVLLAACRGPRSSVGEFLGGVSYPLYLYHWTGAFAASYMAKHLPLPSVGLTAFVLSVAVGVAAYLAIDRNVMHWRAKFYRPSVGTAAMFGAYSLLAIGVAGHFVFM